MSLNPPASIGIGLATGAVVYAIHSNFTPAMADMQALPAGNADVDAAERKATWMSAGVVAGISLLAKDPTIFVIGSAVAIGMAWFTRHAVHTESKSGIAAGPGVSATSANDLAAGPQMTTSDYHMFAGANEFVSS